MSPPSRARTVALAVVAGVAIGTLIGFVLSSGGDNGESRQPITATTTSSSSTPTADQSSPATTTFVPDPVPPAPVTPDTGPVPVSPPPPAPAAAPPAASPNADPTSVVRGFIGAWMSWSWSDQPDPTTAMRERVRPWVTPALAERLAQSSSAAYATSLRIAAHETATPEVVSVDQPEPNRYLSLVTVHVQRDDTGSTKQSRYVDVRLVEAAGGWYVDEITP